MSQSFLLFDKLRIATPPITDKAFRIHIKMEEKDGKDKIEKVVLVEVE